MRWMKDRLFCLVATAVELTIIKKYIYLEWQHITAAVNGGSKETAWEQRNSLPLTVRVCVRLVGAKAHQICPQWRPEWPRFLAKPVAIYT